MRIVLRTLPVVGLVLSLTCCRGERTVEPEEPSEPRTHFGRSVAGAKQVGADLEERDEEVRREASEMFDQ